jgi:hypothetical protein
MAPGLSIALIIALGLFLYMAVELQKTEGENLSLRSQLKQQKENG